MAESRRRPLGKEKGSSIGPPCQVRQRFSGRVGGIRGNEKVTNLEAFGGARPAGAGGSERGPTSG